MMEPALLWQVLALVLAVALVLALGLSDSCLPFLVVVFMLGSIVVVCLSQ